jgi:hypothetical protein
MAYTAPGTVASGDVATAAAWNVVVGDIVDHETRITALTPATRTVAKARIAVNSTSSSWTNPTSFTVIPQTDDYNALSTSFVKAGGTATNLVISVHGSAYLTSGVAQVATWGCKVGATSTAIAAFPWPVTAPSRIFWGGTTMITGLAAGTYTIDPVLKTATAAAVTLLAANDSVSISITETPV